MKRFLITFSAVIAALVVVVLGLAFLGHFNQWNRAKTDKLRALTIQEQHYQQLTLEAKEYYKVPALDMAGAGIAHAKEILKEHYAHKPWFYTAAERRQIKQWTDDVIAFNGRSQVKSAGNTELEFPPVPTTNLMHFIAPPYPHEAEERHLIGNGFAQASFDDTGHCCNVVMTVSTGAGILDMNTINFGQTHWTGMPNTTEEVPITYRLH